MRGTILLFNQGAERICGYKAVDVIGRMSVRQLYPPGIAREVMRLIRSAEHGGGGRLEPVRRHLITADGQKVPVSISAALVLDDEGREIATVGIFSDLRERLHMEERLASRAGEAGGVGEAGGRDGAGGRRRARAQSAAHVGDGLRAGVDAQAGRRPTRTGRWSRPSSTRPTAWRRSCASSAA